MSIYMFNLGITYILSWGVRKSNRIRRNGEKRWTFPLIMITACFTIIASLRYGVGTDFWDYYEMYKNQIPLISFKNSKVEIGFFLLCKLLSLFSRNPQLMFTVIALVINLLIIKTTADFSRPLELGIFLYVTTFIYYSTFNGIRQYLSAAIVFWAIRYMFEGKSRKYFAAVIIAAFFHVSSLIMIPVYYIVRRKAWTKVNLILAFFFLGATLFYKSFVGILLKLLASSRYESYGSSVMEANAGANILRVLVIALPLLIAYIFRKKLEKADYKNNYIVNLYFIGLMFMLLATRHWIFARMAMFFDIYGLLLIPELTRIFDRKTNRAVYLAVIIMYLLYSTVLLLSGESNIYPYKTIFH